MGTRGGVKWLARRVRSGRGPSAWGMTKVDRRAGRLLQWHDWEPALRAWRVLRWMDKSTISPYSPVVWNRLPFAYCFSGRIRRQPMQVLSPTHTALFHAPLHLPGQRLAEQSRVKNAIPLLHGRTVQVLAVLGWLRIDVRHHIRVRAAPSPLVKQLAPRAQAGGAGDLHASRAQEKTENSSGSPYPLFGLASGRRQSAQPGAPVMNVSMPVSRHLTGPHASLIPCPSRATPGCRQNQHNPIGPTPTR